jgi:hypothetical protein
MYYLPLNKIIKFTKSRNYPEGIQETKTLITKRGKALPCPKLITGFLTSGASLFVEAK